MRGWPLEPRGSGQKALASDSILSMDDRALISVQDAAARLGVSADAVRKRISAGSLPAERRGRDWWVDRRFVDQLGRQSLGPGRPLSPEMAWGVLLLASGDEKAAAAAAQNPRYPSRLRAWLGSHSLVEHASHLRARAAIEDFDSHPSELPRILERPDVLATGISAGDTVGLVGGGSAIDVYAAARLRDAFVDEHLLAPGPGPVRIRWAPDEIWPLLDGDGDGRAPRAAVLLDLLEHDDPRARREAARALAR
jgi:excisionase family DNA binding protein